MPTRSGSMHVATTRRQYKGKIYETHLLRRTYREGDKVKHQTLGNLSHLPAPIIDLIRRSLAGETFVPPEAVFEIVRSRPHGHVAAVLGMWRGLSMDALIDDQPSRQRDLVAAMVVQRILEPRSKLATARALNEETLHSSLGEMLEVAAADEDELYEAMDWLQPRQERIERALAKQHLSEGTLILYDLTSVYLCWIRVKPRRSRAQVGGADSRHSFDLQSRPHLSRSGGGRFVRQSGLPDPNDGGVRSGHSHLVPPRPHAYALIARSGTPALSAVSFQRSAFGVIFATSPRFAEKLRIKNLCAESVRDPLRRVLFTPLRPSQH